MTSRNLKLNEDKLKVLKVKDKTDKLTVSVNRLFDLPFRLILTGKTGSTIITDIIKSLKEIEYSYSPRVLMLMKK